MRDVIDRMLQAWRSGETAGLATVVHTFRSAPREPGAAMLVTTDGAALGSVSGGCVEGAVYELAAEAITDAAPVLETFGISDDDAFAVGLSCGGILDVFIEQISRAAFPEFEALAADVVEDRPVALVTIVGHPDSSRLGAHLVVRPDDTLGTLGSPVADMRVGDDVRGLLAQGRTGIVDCGPDGQRLGTGMRLFVQSFAPAPRMLVFGATAHAAALARQGAFLGFRVTVCDARPVFTTAERFPGVEVVVDRPDRYLAGLLAAGELDERAVICVLTHDAKFDVPLLEVALRGPHVAYLGAMGSRRTHDDRVGRLRAAGITDEELARLRSPLGLDLGARTPEETAGSIAAEIVAARWGGSGAPLAGSSGPIHRLGTSDGAVAEPSSAQNPQI